MIAHQKICPEVLPVFPLTGVLLLPGGRLPLHIFEERYRNLAEDALEGEGFLGMIQPMAPASQVDDRDHPELYGVGCAGLIERSERFEDGRFVVILKGMARFRIRRELPLERGYRRVEADYGDFREDLAEEGLELESDRLINALQAFGEAHRIPLELGKLDQLSGLELLNSIAMGLPFQPAEKQAILEASDVEQRLETLLTLLGMGVDLRREAPPPSAN